MAKTLSKLAKSFKVSFDTVVRRIVSYGRRENTLGQMERYQSNLGILCQSISHLPETMLHATKSYEFPSSKEDCAEYLRGTEG